MSTGQPQPIVTKPAADNRQITIVSHSTLFYWWPVWAVAFLLGLLSWGWGWRMVVLPHDTEVVKKAAGIGVTMDEKDGAEKAYSFKDRDALVLSEEHTKNHSLPERPLRLHMVPGKGFGVLFATVLLLVIVITNVPLRGMWSFMVIFLVIALSIIFGLAGWWGNILHVFNLLDIRINAGGYFYIGGILFCIWLFTVFVFDKQIYMVFAPGQFKVCTEIGGGEQTYPTFGMTFEKQRTDLFRHWIIGLGSGDLIVKGTGAQALHFEMPNVLFINSKKQKIEDMVRKIPD